jgi:hypothetical protein
MSLADRHRAHRPPTLPGALPRSAPPAAVIAPAQPGERSASWTRSPETAYRGAVKAIESAAQAVVQPNHPGATPRSTPGRAARQSGTLDAGYPRQGRSGAMTPLMTMIGPPWTPHGVPAGFGRCLRRVARSGFSPGAPGPSQPGTDLIGSSTQPSGDAGNRPSRLTIVQLATKANAACSVAGAIDIA